MSSSRRDPVRFTQVHEVDRLEDVDCWYEDEVARLFKSLRRELAECRGDMGGDKVEKFEHRLGVVNGLYCVAYSGFGASEPRGLRPIGNVSYVISRYCEVASSTRVSV
jgi:hypothetical protein